MYAFVRRLPIERGCGRRWQTLGAYAVAAVVAVLLKISAVSAGWSALLGPQLSLAEAFSRQINRLLAYDALILVLMLLSLHGVVYYRTLRDKEVEAARLQSQLADARLGALTLQLQPHFLFNTLNTISGLVTLDPRRADRMITRLADLLRVSLSRQQSPLVPFRDELSFTDQYLELQQARFEERLVVTRYIAPSVAHALVPPFLLQPIVENTIRHALSPNAAPIHLVITARRSGRWLAIRVTDDGPGLPPYDRDSAPQGIGLANIRRRLSQLYGGSYRFVIAGGETMGVEVQIELPWRVSPDVQRTDASDA